MYLVKIGGEVIEEKNTCFFSYSMYIYYIVGFTILNEYC